MAKNRQLMERWRKWEAKKRRTKPKQFSNRAYGIIDRGAMREAGVNAYGHRARSFMGIEEEKLLHFLFGIPDNPTIRPSNDPRLAVEYRIEYLKMEGPFARLLEFTCIFLEGSEESERSTRLFFRGQEFFLVHHDVSVWKRSIIYSDHDWVMRLYQEGRIKWLPPVIIPSNTPPSVAPSPDG